MNKSFKPLAQFDVSDEDLRTEIGLKIRKVRMEAGYTIKDLADCLEVTRGFISNLEHGVTGCSLSNLIKIAKAFDVDPAWLAGFRAEDNDPYSPDPADFSNESIVLKEPYLQKAGLKKDHLFSVTIETADMSPLIKPGSIVIADANQQGILDRE
ncbi:helix-turn-helix transcriptional regulator, partial [Endozoicomonas sp. SM1973]